MVITGDTGSGKSTQLPQYIYDSPEIRESLKRGHHSNQHSHGKETHDKINIVVTQPRRVATISMTKRICYERGLPEAHGGEVAYAIRFDDRTSDRTKLRYVTDGILVRECISVGDK